MQLPTAYLLGQQQATTYLLIRPVIGCYCTFRACLSHIWQLLTCFTSSRPQPAYLLGQLLAVTVLSVLVCPISGNYCLVSRIAGYYLLTYQASYQPLLYFPYLFVPYMATSDLFYEQLATTCFIFLLARQTVLKPGVQVIPQNVNGGESSAKEIPRRNFPICQRKFLHIISPSDLENFPNNQTRSNKYHSITPCP